MMSQMQGWPQDQQWNDPDVPAPRRRGMPIWAWVLIILGGLGLFSCVSCLGVLAWLGANTPETWAYAGNEVPPEYQQIMRDVGVLDDDEKLLWFYSDGLTDIRSGFYFVSDKKVVIYRQDFQPAATTILFDDIAGVDLARGASWLEDSAVTLTLADGTVASFPVSIERDGDLKFVDAIEARMTTE